MKKQNKLSMLLLASALMLCPVASIMAAEHASSIDAVQQSRTVSFTVNDAYGPIVGANILVKGTSNGTITDLDGNAKLSNAPAGSVVVVSYIGYVSKEITLTNETSYTIELEEESQTLNEVVVVGYGVQKKSQVTGAISSVKAEDMENRAFTDAVQALQGKTAGVQLMLSSGQPGQVGNVRIRGVGSNSSNEPLYIVDGRQVSDIGYLDSNDIESMEILKDASAAAIYGARAGNGVVLITTKTGSKNSKGKVTYSFMQSWQTTNNLPKLMNAQQFYDYQTLLAPGNQTAMNSDWGNKTTDTDWLDYMFGTGNLQRHNVSFSGGTSDLTYYAAFSSNVNDGPIIGTKDKYTRYTGTFNGDYQVNKWLKVSTANNISYTRTNGMNNDVFGSAMRFSPLITPTVAQPTDFMKSVAEDQGYMYIMDWQGNGEYCTYPEFPTGDNVNPLVLLNRTNEFTKGTRFNGTTTFTLTPIKGLVINSRISYMTDGNRNYRQTLPGYYNTQGKSYNQTVTATDRTSEGIQWENFANYSFSLGEHNFTAMAGMSYINNQSSYVTGTVTGTGTDSGFVNTDPNYAYFAYKAGGYNQTVSGGEEYPSRQVAYYGRLNWDFKDRYYVQASLRADAADWQKLPTEGRWGYFPAASLGWTISNEEFMKDIDWLSHLKLRASWGQNGSTAGLGNYAWQSVITAGQVYSFQPDVMNYTTSSAPSTAGNKKLKWETSEQLDFGFDLRLFKNKITFSYDWYKKTTKDLILTNITPSYIMGVTASPFNAGKVSNVGHEFELTYRDKIGKDFNFSVKANFTTLKNRVDEITSSLTYIEGSSYDNQVITWFEQGYPMWHFKTFKYTGVDELGNPTFLDANNNGALDAEDKVDCGSGIPTYSYGITLNASWKNFDLTIFGSGQGGNKIMQTITRAFQLQSNIPTYLVENAWTPENHTNTPKVGMDNVGYYYISDAQIYKGDFFKLKQIQLGYTLPSKFTKKFLVENLRIYGSIENLFTITSYPGFDPEIMSSGSGIGIDAGRYPNNRNFIIGANITF